MTSAGEAPKQVRIPHLEERRIRAVVIAVLEKSVWTDRPQVSLWAGCDRQAGQRVNEGGRGRKSMKDC